MSLHASPYPTSQFPSNEPQNDERIQRVLQAIQADPSQDIAALATVAGLSVSRLSHLFTLEKRCRLRSYLVDCRLQWAAAILRNSETPVKAISYDVGYGHPASFVRAFRAKFGCSPRQYRSQARILQNA